MKFLQNAEYQKIQLALAKLLCNSLNLQVALKSMAEDRKAINFSSTDSDNLIGGTTMLTGSILWTEKSPFKILLGIIPTVYLYNAENVICDHLMFIFDGENFTIQLVRIETSHLHFDVSIEVVA